MTIPLHDKMKSVGNERREKIEARVEELKKEEVMPLSDEVRGRIMTGVGIDCESLEAWADSIKELEQQLADAQEAIKQFTEWNNQLQDVIQQLREREAK